MKNQKTRVSRQANLGGLSKAQIDHVMRSFPENRASMADYLRQGVDVYFYRHDEVPDVPPVAIAVVQDPAYWIDCAESEDVAVLLATQLGLSVTRGIL
ncbi:MULTISPECIES: hypothetical protein [unclassified Pseudomonas]|uniref:hypothetical protein n=1 Tax=unclassified Pseudomonas TaxID=196821 RepID=UPI00190BBC96|nr:MULTISPECIES: hypothetical protein [unclassified Pseudomonas]MBK3468857.1 hypothetical protein [Pseudomonas sp. MF6776]